MHQPIRWLYVQAIVEGHPQDPGGIRFQHTFVNGVDEDEAYLAGQRYFEVQGFRCEDGEFANDYVIQLGSPRE